MNWFRWADHDLLLEVAAQPGAKRNEILGLHGERLKVRIHAPPLEGRANSMLIEFFSDCFAVPKNRITIEQGEQGRQKRIRIRAVTTIPTALAELGLTLP